MRLCPSGNKLPVSAAEFRRQFGPNPDPQILIVRREKLRLAPEHIQHARVRIGEKELRLPDAVAEHGAQPLGEHIGSLTGFGRDTDNVISVGQNSDVEIAFVEHAQAGRLLGAELLHKTVYDFGLLFPFGIGEIDDMQQNVRVAQLFQRRLERFHQMGGKLADKTDGIGEQNLLPRSKRKTPGRRVKRIKQPVIGRDRRRGQGVEQRGLTGIGVADERDQRKAVLEPQTSLGAPLFPNLGERTLQGLNLSADVAPVGFQLCFAGTARPDGSVSSCVSPGPRVPMGELPPEAV